MIAGPGTVQNSTFWMHAANVCMRCLHLCSALAPVGRAFEVGLDSIITSCASCTVVYVGARFGTFFACPPGKMYVGARFGTCFAWLP
eukprot:509160-Prymnesium_polylepis.1